MSRVTNVKCYMSIFVEGLQIQKFMQEKEAQIFSKILDKKLFTGRSLSCT